MRYRLINKDTREEVKIGEVISDGKGSYGRLFQAVPPAALNPYGYIVVDESYRALYYPSSYGLEFVAEPDPDDLDRLASEVSADLEESARRLVL